MAQSPFQKPTDFIFTTSAGWPYLEGFLRDSMLYAAMDAAKIKREPHKHGGHLFRHTAGAKAHAKTRDMKVVLEMLGQAN